ncbi:addiction module toxin RelE [Maribrevibacterium harenarium]|uniref:Addiction module toxin RelE n=1 Tax=Maribrevibacterium harenarium TaxID=2589817 RepID=A0A501W890_9GAMM|nr:addiction module toxin RelE [Maribrevibacterium harenarium]
MEHSQPGTLFARRYGIFFHTTRNGTGGIRKLRWSRGSKGKSGGVRVIYYYHDERIPLYLLTMFGKNERANLSKSDRNALSQLVSILVKTALEKQYD